MSDSKLNGKLMYSYHAVLEYILENSGKQQSLEISQKNIVQSSIQTLEDSGNHWKTAVSFGKVSEKFGKTATFSGVFPSFFSKFSRVFFTEYIFKNFSISFPELSTLFQSFSIFLEIPPQDFQIFPPFSKIFRIFSTSLEFFYQVPNAGTYK